MRNKRTKQILALLMTLVISLATLAPATVSAEAGANNGSEVIYANDFSSGSVQTNVGQYVFAAQNYAPTVANGYLTVTKGGDAYVSIRPDQEQHNEYKNDGAKAMKGDLSLSFKLMLNSTLNMGTLKCGDNAVSRNALEFMSVSGGAVKTKTGGVNKPISLNEWHSVEIVFNYGAAAAKFISYTVLVDGDELATIAITDGPAYINSFELFRWAADGASLALDDVNLSFGAGNRGAGSPAQIYGVDFVGVTKVPTNGERLNNFRVMNGYLNNSKTKVQNDTLRLVADGSQSYADANPDAAFGFSGTQNVSMELRPIGTSWNGGTFLNFRYKASGETGTKNMDLISFAEQNRIKVNGTVKTLSSYRFNTVESVFHYDYEQSIFTSADVYLNGELVNTVDLSDKKIVSIDWCRILVTYTNNNGMELRSFRVTKGSKLLHEEDVTEFIGYQTTAANTESNTFNLRLLAITTDEDLSKYENVGFKVTATYGNTTMTLPEELGVCTAVYESVTASAGIETVYTAETLGGSGIFALNCLNLPTQSGAITFTVTTYYTVAGQESVEERSFTFTVDPSTDIPKGGVN